MNQGNSPPRAVVAGVVLLRRDDAALLQLRDIKPGLTASGQLVFPGGHCHAGEELTVCAAREFREETGYACANLELLTTFDHRSPDTAKEFRLHFYWTEYDGVQPIHCFEGQKICFVSRAEAGALPMPEYVLPVWDLARARFASVTAQKEGFTVTVKTGTHNGSSQS